MQLQFTKPDGTPATELAWTPTTTYVDGSSFDASQFKGYMLGTEANGTISDFVAIPAAYDITSWPLDQLGLQTAGTLNVALKTIAANGQESGWSNVVSFTAEDVTVPKPPGGLSVS